CATPQLFIDERGRYDRRLVGSLTGLRHEKIAWIVQDGARAARWCAVEHIAQHFQRLFAGDLHEPAMAALRAARGTHQSAQAGVAIGPEDDLASAALSHAAGIDERTFGDVHVHGARTHARAALIPAHMNVTAGDRTTAVEFSGAGYAHLRGQKIDGSSVARSRGGVDHATHVDTAGTQDDVITGACDGVCIAHALEIDGALDHIA